MSIVIWSGDLIVRDSADVLGLKEVFVLPKRGDVRRLSNAEARHALAFMGMIPSQAEADAPPAATPSKLKRIHLANEEASATLNGRQSTVLRLLGKDGDQMRVQDIADQVGDVQGTVAGNLYKLERLQLASRIRAKGVIGNPDLWQITAAGIDALAEIAPEIAPDAT